MKSILSFLVVLFIACNASNSNDAGHNDKDSVIINNNAGDTKAENKTPVKSNNKVYSNDRFKNVTAQKINDTTFLIRGKAQVFEAAFSYVIKDGDTELKQGSAMTDAGAPAWGNFSFTVNIPSQTNSLQLILFEASPKDGSRQYELPVPLR